MSSIVFAFIIFMLSIITIHRNSFWRNDLSLWKDVAIKSPGNPRGHNNLGNAYKERGEKDSAFIEYKTALKLNPTFSNAHNNLGVLYKEKGLLDEAINEYVLAAKYSSSSFYKKIIYQNLGTVLAENGLIDDAINSYKEALKIAPADSDDFYNIGFLYSQKGMTDMAIKFYSEALRVNPYDIGAKKELERLLKTKQKQGK